MANDIGSIKGITGNSVSINNQSGAGGQKPSAAGSGNPNNCKPPKPADGPVAMPK